MRVGLKETALLVAWGAALLDAGGLAAEEPAAPAPTFEGPVASILQRHCQGCHFDGGIAPFPLVDYEDVVARRAKIRQAVASRSMPPWKPAEGCGEFRGDRRLSEEEIATILRWVDAGTPRGVPTVDRDAPVFESGWSLGPPDLVLASDVPFTAPETGDEYRCFSFPVGLAEDRWVGNFDVRPGDPRTVHHVALLLDRLGISRLLDEASPGPGYQCFGGPGFPGAELFGVWGPGVTPPPLPEGTAALLPAGARLVGQIHYSAHFATPRPDRTEVGLYFATGAIDRPLEFWFVMNREFEIPPGARDHLVVAEPPLPEGAASRGMRVISVFPHMHLLGKSIRVLKVAANGDTSCLVDIPEYEFRQQRTYVYQQSQLVKPGERLRLECRFDNSAANPANPNEPPIAVGWGEASTDEMCLATVGYTLE